MLLTQKELASDRKNKKLTKHKHTRTQEVPLYFVESKILLLNKEEKLKRNEPSDEGQTASSETKTHSKLQSISTQITHEEAKHNEIKTFKPLPNMLLA